MQTIEIDFEVWKEITSRRLSEVDSPNDVLRRQFELPPRHDEETSDRSSEKPWEPKGVTFSHGTKLRARYKGQVYYATVQDGVLVYSDNSYRTPSAAAKAITGTNVDGWWFWEYEVPGRDSWKKIGELRQD